MKHQLNSLKVFNAVKCGVGEYMFLQDKDFELTLVDSLVFIKERKTGAEVVTPITNTPWFTIKALSATTDCEKDMAVAKEGPKLEQTSSTKDTVGAPPKKTKHPSVVNSFIPETE